MEKVEISMDIDFYYYHIELEPCTIDTQNVRAEVLFFGK